MNRQWYDFFQALDSLSTDVTAYWWMSNGAEFWMTIPKWSDIMKRSRVQEEGYYPFELMEIVKMEIPRQKSMNGPFEIRNDLDSIFNAISGLEGLNLTVSDEVLSPASFVIQPN